MKTDNNLRNSRNNGKRIRNTSDPIRSFMLVTACAAVAVVIAVGSKVADTSENSQVYAAAESENGQSFAAEAETFAAAGLPTGIAGVVTGVQGTADAETSVERIGTSCEQVMVGQRVKKVEDTVADFDVSAAIESKVNDLDAKTITLAETPKIMSDTDYETLLRIVEAEAGTEDVKGRALVANVIMNRVKNDEFPNTVTEVVWESTNGVPQFSPTYDGRISEVTVSDETREAVKQVLEGVDYSEGALFFIQKSQAESHNVTWFEKDLKKLFKYGVHEFYTYPEEGDTEDKAKDPV